MTRPRPLPTTTTGTPAGPGLTRPEERPRGSGRLAALGALLALFAASRPLPAAPPERAELALAWSFVEPAAAGAIDRVNDVAVDPAGDLLLCGTSVEPGGLQAAVVMKLDGLTGDAVWTTRLDLSIADSAVALVVDEQGSAYVAGNTTPSPPFPDALIARVDADGALAWARSFDELDNNDEGLDVALGPDDSVVLVGHLNGLEGANFLTAKLSRSGELRWLRQLDGGAGSQTDEALAVGIGPSAEVFVSGTSTGPATDFRPDVLTARYSPDGELSWTQRHDGTAALHDRPWDLAATADGGAVVVGTTENAHSSADPLVLRYTGDGTLAWLRDKGSKGGDSARAVVLDEDGGILVAGTTFSGGGGFDALVFRLEPDGRKGWSLRWDGGQRLGDAAQALALDGQGHVLVGATTVQPGSETDVSALLIDARRGRLLASRTFDGALSRTDAPLAVAADGDGGLFLGGFTNFPLEDFLALRYELAGP